MAIDVAALNAKIEEGIALVDAGDFSGALPKFLSAQAMLAAIPDGSQSFASIRYDRAALHQLIQNCRQQQSAKAGVGITKIRYKTAGAC